MATNKEDIKDILIGVRGVIRVCALLQCMVKGESNLIPHTTCYAEEPSFNKSNLTKEEKERGERLRNRYQGFMG